MLLTSGYLVKGSFCLPEISGPPKRFKRNKDPNARRGEASRSSIRNAMCSFMRKVPRHPGTLQPMNTSPGPTEGCGAGTRMASSAAAASATLRRPPCDRPQCWRASRPTHFVSLALGRPVHSSRRRWRRPTNTDAGPLCEGLLDLLEERRSREAWIVLWEKDGCSAREQ